MTPIEERTARELAEGAKNTGAAVQKPIENPAPVVAPAPKGTAVFGPIPAFLRKVEAELKGK
jgi:hypothetical protein